jgi:uncharacterized protein YjlB
MEELVNSAAEVSHHIVPGNKIFPNNKHLPVLVFKQVLQLPQSGGNDIVQKRFESNDWKNCWNGDVFQYHHYHSNAHEALGISNGNIMLQLGGEDGSIISLSKGDVILIPAGVAHKNVGSSDTFSCVGAYPKGQEYDVNYGKPEEREKAEENIANVYMPLTDPIFGNKGPLHQHWKKDESKKVLETSRQF